MAVRSKTTRLVSPPTTLSDTSILDEFWLSFRLSPNRFEHRLLTDMRWLGLAALGPFVAMTILQVAYFVIRFDFRIADFVIVIDPFLTFITTSLLLAALTYRYFWYPGIRQTFHSLYRNSVLYEQDRSRVSPEAYVEYLNAQLRYLHSPRRYQLPLGFTALFVLLLWAVNGSFIRSAEGNPALAVVVFLYLCMPLVWAVVGGLGLWTVIAITKAIMDLTPRFVIQIQPLHSDKTGGLKKLGDLCSQVGIMVIVIIIPLMFYVVDSVKNNQTAILTSVVTVMCIIIAFAFWIVIKPLWDIHESMVVYKQERERELDEKARVLYEQFNILLKLDKLEDADVVKKKIRILTDEMEMAQKYPQWPISYIPVFRSVIASGVLSSLVSYLALVFKFTTGEGLNAFLELVKSISSN